MAAGEHPDDYTMSFGDHLEELRRRLLWSLAAPLPLSIVLFVISDPLVQWLYRPLDGVLTAFELPRRLQVLGPAEALVVKIKLSLIFAIVLSAPWILWQAWLFIRPGLYRHERRFVHVLIPGSAVLTVAGVALMYYVMLPLMLRMLVLFGTSLQLGGETALQDARIAAALESAGSIEVRLAAPDDPVPGDLWVRYPQMLLYAAVEAGDGAAGAVEIVQVPPPGKTILAQEFRLTTYVNFVLILLLGISLAFQMPLVLLLLGWLGLVSPQTLREKRRYAVFTCGVLAAVTTPADVLSMVLMFIPLVALYELSILLLVFAPASKVAEGRLFRSILRRRRSPRE